ncbi:MAG: 4Fe-4S dicluster domain-containing protein [Candidatus Bathyarchaeia archaeon]
MAEEKSPNFVREIISRLGGETITHCYQCGTCASTCPVARTTERYNPRQVLRLALLGQRDEVLKGNAIWLCASCYNCQERCPQKVEVADVIYALRNTAIQEGNIPAIYAEFATGLMNEGRLAPISKFIEKKRTEFGLPPLKPANLEALRKILAATGFDKIMFKRGEATQ